MQTANNRALNRDKEFFRFMCSEENMELPENLPDIGQIVSAVIEPEIISLRSITTPEGLSYEGSYLSGKKVVVVLKLKQKILYAAGDEEQSVHVFEMESLQSSYVVIPHYINGTQSEFLIKDNYLKTDIQVEEFHIKQVDNRRIFKHVALFIKMLHIPTYQLCYSLHRSCKESDIFLIYENGTHSTQITSGTKSRSINPLWSPLGNEIAFLDNTDGVQMLYIYSVRAGVTRRVTKDGIFNAVGSFCWSTDGTKLVFSACTENDREIFVVNTCGTNIRQLTYGNNVLKSFKPRCSPDGDKIAFLRSFSGLVDIWMMGIDGMNCSKLTTCGNIKYIDWLKDSKTLAFIKSNNGKSDEFHFISSDGKENKVVEGFGSIINKRNIQTSPDGQYVAFIGVQLETENIYVYDLKKECVENITNSLPDTNISDFVWKPHSGEIYYSCNELFTYNIYSISFTSGLRKQLVSSNASYIQLSYRNRIG